MDVKELLIPRLKITANFPNSRFPIGYVLSLDSIDTGEYYHKYTADEPIHLEVGDELKYPEVMRLMQWHEDRKPEDLPKYLKCYEVDVTTDDFKRTGNIEFVLKVEKYLWHIDEKFTRVHAFEYLWKKEPYPKRMSITEWYPATEEEYKLINEIK